MPFSSDSGNQVWFRHSVAALSGRSLAQHSLLTGCKTLFRSRQRDPRQYQLFNLDCPQRTYCHILLVEQQHLRQVFIRDFVWRTRLPSVPCQHGLRFRVDCYFIHSQGEVDTLLIQRTQTPVIDTSSKKAASSWVCSQSCLTRVEDSNFKWASKLDG